MNIKKKYKDLLKNVGILTLGNFGSKLLSFFLIPLYTAVLTTEEYGKFDFINTTVFLLVPIFTMNIFDGTMRFLLDDKKDTKEIMCISFKYFLISTILIILLSFVNFKLGLIQIFKDYCIYFIVYYISYSIYEFAQCSIRGMDKLSEIAKSGVLNSLLMLTLNIFFLICLKMRLEGYFLAYIIANLISSIYLFKKIHIFRYLKDTKNNKILEKEMLNYSKPLIFNNIGWWIINASDKYMVTYICGLAINGIYSIAYKIPSVLYIVQNIFSQAWTITAVKNFDKNDEDNFIKNMYISYNIILVVSCSLLIIFAQVLAKFLYMNNFYVAWKYMPFLTIALVFGGLSGFLGTLFVAEKKTKIMGFSAVIGAIINIILNLILIKKMTALGAAIATCISYIVVWIIRILFTKKMIVFKVNLGKDILVYLLLILQSIFMLIIKNYVLLYFLEILIFIIQIFMYKKEIIEFINNAIKKVKGRMIINGKI